MTSTIKVDTISENTSANGVSIDGLTIKDGGITATTGSIVFNEASADVDFRVESNGNANMLFVDGGNDRVAIGTSNVSSTAPLSISSGFAKTDTSSRAVLNLQSNEASAQSQLRIMNIGHASNQPNRKWQLQTSEAGVANSGQLELQVDGGSVQMGATGGGLLFVGADDIVVNEGSTDTNFRVESNGNANMIFVDGGNNHVNIGTATDLGGVLNVAGTQYNLVAGQNDFVIGSSNAGGATLVLDGDSNGDAAGGDYSYIKHTTSGTLEIAQDSPSGTNTMLFKTADTHQWTLDASGNWLPAATDHGIYLGVTSATASNLLDDYEEGTWTPVIKSHANTISRASGSEFNTYTKIGRQVTVTFSIQAVTLSGTINNAGDFTRIQGLPFTTSSTAGQRFPSTQLMYFSSGSKFEEENITCNVGTQSNYVEVHEHDGAGTGYSPARIASLTSNTYWFFTMTYFI